MTMHGAARRGAKTPEYLIWVSMRQRCMNPRNRCFDYYGGRGIKVCPRWDIFQNFLTDMGPRPSPMHSIDRIDNDADYTPENCRWATAKEQTSHTRRNILVTVRGEEMTLMQAVERHGGRYGTILARHHRGVPIEKALRL